MVFGTSSPGKNPSEFLFLKPNLLVDAMIAQVSLIKYFILEFLAYLTLRTQKTQWRRA